MVKNKQKNWSLKVNSELYSSSESGTKWAAAWFRSAVCGRIRSPSSLKALKIRRINRQMTQAHPSQRDTEEGERRGKQTLALVTVLPFYPAAFQKSRLKSSPFSFFSCLPLSLSLIPLSLPLSLFALSETGRLLWQLAKGYCGIYQRGGRRGDKTVPIKR